jgi:putative aminopeptidase FrvX
VKLPPPSSALIRRILKIVLTQPTAPYHEHRVRDALAGLLREAGIRPRIDRAGNLHARYRRGKGHPVALAAHMDHPGMEILSVRDRQAQARWNGQMPTFDMRGKRLAVWPARSGARHGTATVLKGDGRPVQGKSKSASGKGRPKSDLLTLRVPRGTTKGDFGYADLTPLAFTKGRIISKALDNVGGCCAIVATMIHLAKTRTPADVRGLFTRAEETGFQGAFAAIKERTLPLNVPLIVLECSKQLPGAEMGKGPVIRIGDAVRVFDADVASACEAAARSWQATHPRFKFQRRLMDGGACEATAFGLAGYKCICMAFPLGNYHNIGPRGVGAEFINEGDFVGGVELLTAFGALGVDPKGVRSRLVKRLNDRYPAAAHAKLKKSR